MRPNIHLHLIFSSAKSTEPKQSTFVVNTPHEKNVSLVDMETCDLQSMKAALSTFQEHVERIISDRQEVEKMLGSLDAEG